MTGYQSPSIMFVSCSATQEVETALLKLVKAIEQVVESVLCEQLHPAT
jgi:hypothetical protein